MNTYIHAYTHTCIHVLFIILLNFIILSVIMLSVVAPFKVLTHSKPIVYKINILLMHWLVQYNFLVERDEAA
jgi:hypothetical protein